MTPITPKYEYDSLNEGRVAKLLSQAKLRFDKHLRVPITTWPWKTVRSRGAPKCDFYLPDSNIYIEVKGWMTLYGLAKSAWLSKQGFPYYFFQNDDSTWEPFIDSPVPITIIDRKSNAALKRSSVFQQIEELRHFARVKGDGCASLSRARIQRHIKGRIENYRNWVGEFP